VFLFAMLKSILTSRSTLEELQKVAPLHNDGAILLQRSLEVTENSLQIPSESYHYSLANDQRVLATL
jgi:hypothetical protein